jgi:deoxyribodipyrimidine photo-lyase
MNEAINIFWFRRDLRLDDNCGLYHALSSGLKVLPIFIFDTAILNKLHNKTDGRVHFIHQELKKLKTELEKKASSLLVVNTTADEAFKTITEHYTVKNVFTNSDYEPQGITRDNDVKQFLNENGISFFSFKDMVVFEKNEVVKEDGTPYLIYTPYSKKWKEGLKNYPVTFFPSEELLDNLYQTNPIPFPSLEDIGFNVSPFNFPEKKILAEQLKNYEFKRDFPAVNGTSKLGVHLRFGTISIRKMVNEALDTSEKYLNELIWREFYQTILFHFPYVINSAFKKEYNQIEWNNNEDYFNAWCNGNTGFPIVDAGMRELNTTGYMHNRVRMIVAGFLTKNLLIDWRWGEAYFAEKLLDFELASNNGGWQWAAGCGVDAAPYFRVFNPEIQAQKFDPKNEYIKKWIPELHSSCYLEPIVDYKTTKENTIKKYKRTLNNIYTKPLMPLGDRAL